MKPFFAGTSVNMSLELYVGPMWAGKSSTVLGTLRRYTSIGWNILVLTAAADTRYGTEMIVSHDQDTYPARSIQRLTPLCYDPEYSGAQLIVIEEAQFFPDLYEFVLTAVEKDNKHVICVGLDGDSDRKPFGDLLRLVPLCDRLTKLTALCSECKDGSPALFSFYKNLKSSQVAVGASDHYEPLCRKHFITKTAAKEKNE
jgi:thymidine kinase